MKYGRTGKVDGWIWRTFFGPCGFRDDFLRFPYGRCQNTVICIEKEGMLLDAPWLQTAVVDDGFQGRNLIGIQVFQIKLLRMDPTEARPEFLTEGEQGCHPGFYSSSNGSRRRRKLTIA